MNDNFKWALSAVEAEYVEAKQQFGHYNSLHEAGGVIKEEYDELWEAIREWKGEYDPQIRDKVRREAIQLAMTATALAAEANNLV